MAVHLIIIILPIALDPSPQQKTPDITMLVLKGAKETVLLGLLRLVTNHLIFTWM